MSEGEFDAEAQPGAMWCNPMGMDHHRVSRVDDRTVDRIAGAIGLLQGPPVAASVPVVVGLPFSAAVMVMPAMLMAMGPIAMVSMGLSRWGQADHSEGQ